MKPIVSINLCCYNSEKYLRETLQSIIEQTYKDWELVIINDGSSDSTESIIFEYKDKGYPIIYQYQDNKGLGTSRNEAIKLSRGEYIAFIDHDDIWENTKLEKQLSLFEQNTNLGFVYTGAYRINSKGIISGNYFDGIPLLRGNVFEELFFLTACPLISSVIIPKKIFEDVGFFCPKYNICEEYELFLRITSLFPIDYNPECLTKYRYHTDNESKKVDQLVMEELDIAAEWILKNKTLNSRGKRNSLRNKYFKIYLKLFLFYLINRKINNAAKAFINGVRSVGYRPDFIISGVYFYLYKNKCKRLLKKLTHIYLFKWARYFRFSLFVLF